MRTNATKIADNVANSAIISTMWIYPKAARLEEVDEANAYLKVARHSPCAQGKALDVKSGCPHDGAHRAHDGDGGCSCRGFIASVQMATGTAAGLTRRDLQQLGDCARCGHSAVSHGRLDVEVRDEYVRRVKVAVRIDELLDDDGKLFDWSAETDDTRALKKQLVSLCCNQRPCKRSEKRAPHETKQSKKARKTADQNEPSTTLPNADMYHTLNYLYQKAHFLAVREAIDGSSSSGSTQCVEELLSLAKRSVIRL